MRIGFDCTAILPDYVGGVNTYNLGLIKGLVELDDDNYQYIIFCTSKNIKLFSGFQNNCRIIILDEASYYIRKIFRIIPYLLNSKFLWKLFWNIYTRVFQIKTKIENQCDILYTGTTILNIYNLSVPTVLSLHDIQEYHFPEFFTWHELRLRNLAVYNSVNSANIIQVSSEYIKSDLLQHFRFLKESQICVIPEGVDILKFNQDYKIDIHAKYGIPENFIFYPAQLWKHKNHLILLQTLYNINRKNGMEIPLVLTGGKYGAYKTIMEYIENKKLNKVFYLGKVPIEDLISLYKSATYLISTSLHESSCMPVLEAAAAGLPIIASNIAPNIEMSKILQINLFDLSNEHDLKRILVSLWTNQNIRKDQIASNKLNVEYYSWKNCALRYLSLFSKLAI